MATFLQLVNDINQRVNEVELTSSTFDSAPGHYANAKQAINSSIRYIGQKQFEWPFYFELQTLVLTPGTIRYPYPSDIKTVDFDSFRIRRDDTLGNDTQFLRNMSYEEYLRKGVDDEYNTDTGIRELPRYVFPLPNSGFGIWYSPDEAYTLDYDAYVLPTDLSAATDEPTLPESFRHVIVDGAMYYIYFFRGDIETADRLLQKFEEGIKNQRSIYINREDDAYDLRVDPRRRRPDIIGNYY